jgi:hypothetical protein
MDLEERVQRVEKLLFLLLGLQAPGLLSSLVSLGVV